MCVGRGAEARIQRGFTYLWLLAAIAVIGIGLLAVSEMWVSSARRQKLAEMDWIGGQFTRAIGSYYESTPGAGKVYPASLRDLIEDRRYLTMRRHLRTVYPNPFTGHQDWELVLGADGRVRGVRAYVGGEGANLVRVYVYQPAR